MAPICVHRAPRTPPDIATRHIGSRDDLPESVTSIGRYAFDNCPTIIYVPLGSEKIIRTDGGTTRRVSSAMTIPLRSNSVRENARWQQYIKNCCHLLLSGVNGTSSNAYIGGQTRACRTTSLPLTLLVAIWYRILWSSHCSRYQVR